MTSAANQQERLKTIGWMVGFVDGEGCFSVSITKNKTTRLGWQVQPEFVVSQGMKSKDSLEIFKNFFGCGRIFVNRRHDNHKEDLYRYCVRSVSELREIIIPFFKENELQTAKAEVFRKFIIIIGMMTKREHLTKEGVIKIANIAKTLNRQKIPKFLESSETIRQPLFKSKEEIVRSYKRL
jgi:hypothetical protein